MSIVYRLDGALLPYQSVRLQGNDGTNNGFPSFATMGEPGIAAVRIEDPNGTLDINGWHTFTVEETACSKPRIFTGWVLGRTIQRGPYRNSAGRIWQCEIIDQNAIFGFEVFRSTAASVRPAETDVARVQACITSHAMAGTPIHDNGRFSTANPLSLAAANFVGQTPAENLSSTAGQCAKNFYAYWSDSAQQISLHYDAVGSGPAAGISVSNVASDVTSGSGGTVYPPFMDAQLEQDPSPLYTGVLLHWTGGYVYDRNSTVIDDLSPSEFSPTNFLRDLSIDSNRISKASTAASQLQKQLTIHSVEAEELTFAVQVQARDVNLAHAGDVINVRFSHLPGYTSSTPVVITRRLVEPVDGMDALYNLTLTVTNNAVPRGAGGGGSGGFPTQPCQPQLIQSATKTSVGLLDPLVLDHAPTTGNFLIAWTVLRGTAGDELNPDGFTGLGADWIDDPGSDHKALRCRFWYRQVVAGDDATISVTQVGTPINVFYMVAEFSGVTDFQAYSEVLDATNQVPPQEVFGAGPMTPTAGLPTLLIAGITPSHNVSPNQWDPFDSSGATTLGVSGGVLGGSDPKSWVGYKAGPQLSGSPQHFTVVNNFTSGVSRGWAGPMAIFSSDPCDQPTSPGQPVNNDPPTPDVGGGTTTFTTTHPYAEGSLKVYVDGIRQYVTETDPGTGEYTLLFDPRPSEYVVTDYQARTGEG